MKSSMHFIRPCRIGRQPACPRVEPHCAKLYFDFWRVWTVSFAVETKLSTKIIQQPTVVPYLRHDAGAGTPCAYYHGD